MADSGLQLREGKKTENQNRRDLTNCHGAIQNNVIRHPEHPPPQVVGSSGTVSRTITFEYQQTVYQIIVFPNISQ
jgi:hypothetical protein